MRDNAKFDVTASHAIEADSGILRDETINYTSLRASKKQLIPVRRMVFHDAELDKDYVFTTNRFDWSASLVAQIYKQRWQVELFFKWIKQNLKLKCFVGLSDNAVMTQVMVANGCLSYDIRDALNAPRLMDGLGSFFKALCEPDFNNRLSCHTKFSSFSV